MIEMAIIPKIKLGITSPPRKDLNFFRKFMRDSDGDGIMNPMDIAPRNPRKSRVLLDKFNKMKRKTARKTKRRKKK